MHFFCNTEFAGILDGTDSPLLKLASKIAQTHHEKFNVQGHPPGLKGEEIPLVGRIVAVADVYDALSSSRPYKAAFLHADCLEIILRERGSISTQPVLTPFSHTSPKPWKSAKNTRTDRQLPTAGKLRRPGFIPPRNSSLRESFPVTGRRNPLNRDAHSPRVAPLVHKQCSFPIMTCW